MMITGDKIKAARKLLRNGMPAGEVRETLIKEGYSGDDIARVFGPKKIDMRSWYLASGILFFCVGTWYSAFLLLGFSGIMFFLYYSEKQRLHKDR